MGCFFLTSLVHILGGWFSRVNATTLDPHWSLCFTTLLQHNLNSQYSSQCFKFALLMISHSFCQTSPGNVLADLTCCLGIAIHRLELKTIIIADYLGHPIQKGNGLWMVCPLKSLSAPDSLERSQGPAYTLQIMSQPCAVIHFFSTIP